MKPFAYNWIPFIIQTDNGTEFEEYEQQSIIIEYFYSKVNIKWWNLIMAQKEEDNHR